MNILLYGGGVDSTTLMAYLYSQRIPFKVMHCNYGQKAFARERKAAKYFCKRYYAELITPKMDLTFASSCTILKGTSNPTANTKLELRNIVLMSLAGSYIASNSNDLLNYIYVGFHREPTTIPYPDAVLKNVKSLATAMTLSSNRIIKIDAPFKNKTREDIYKLGYKLDSTILEKSYTCYDVKECGVCPHCILKKQIIEKYNLR